MAPTASPTLAVGSRLRYFHSRRIQKKDVVQPWLLRPRTSEERWADALPFIGLLVGTLLAGFLVWDGFNSVINHKYCLVYYDDFSGGLNRDIWHAEQQVGGYGNGEFEQTTDLPENLFVDDNGVLNLAATLQDESLMQHDSVLDLGDKCTGNTIRQCRASAHPKPGNFSVPPVRSARINTKNSVQLTYGRVEVTARLPKGDWLWPAIWMMPVNDTYGPWPASGEIDILESRGNNHTYPQGGNNIASSALHWGPVPKYDNWYRTHKKRTASHTTYSDNFWVFGLEWSEKYLFTWIDNRLMQVLYTPFGKPMWSEGKFGADTKGNGSAFEDPWTSTGHANAPFDQPFYLILSLAVGGTNGWFEDGKAGKPWLDENHRARQAFWDARDVWSATWKQPSLQIRKVGIWQQCNGNEGIQKKDEGS